MGVVSNLRVDFKERNETPILVLVDLHESESSSSDSERRDFMEALERCRAALIFARENDFPVAFVRRKPLPASMLDSLAYPSWLDGFRPQRSDMVFERTSASCYASMEFADMARRSGNLVLAGIFGETGCLATLIEGHGRGHRFTFLADASVSRARDDISAGAMHQCVVGIASLYSQVFSTEGWIESMSRKAVAAG
jgi:nicotinamidase-related amidase